MESSVPSFRPAIAMACWSGSREEAVPAVYCRGRRVRAEMARPEFLYEDLPIPLHQGAADFYRAEGLIES